MRKKANAYRTAPSEGILVVEEHSPQIIVGHASMMMCNNVAKYIKKMVPDFDIPGAGTLRAGLKQGA